MTDDPDIEIALRVLARSDDFRVLRRLPTADIFNTAISTDDALAIAIDVETTGLDTEVDDVIELGMIKFNFTGNGQIGRVIATYQSFNEPSISISNFITELTGIRNSDVVGQKILETDINNFVGDAALIIAHNAAFDRPFCERLFPRFSELPWACSATQIDWRSEGIAGSRLEYIAHSFGRFYEAHRAIDDCNAVVNILSFTLPRSQTLVFLALLRAARQNTVRIFAEGAPYDARLELRRAGYRWNNGQNGYPRAWWKEVPNEQLENELAQLESTIEPSRVSPKLIRMTAKNRFRRKF